MVWCLVRLRRQEVEAVAAGRAAQAADVSSPRRATQLPTARTDCWAPSTWRSRRRSSYMLWRLPLGWRWSPRSFQSGMSAAYGRRRCCAMSDSNTNSAVVSMTTSQNGTKFIAVIEDLKKHFKSGDVDVAAVDGVSFKLPPGELIVLR